MYGSSLQSAGLLLVCTVVRVLDLATSSPGTSLLVDLATPVDLASSIRSPQSIAVRSQSAVDNILDLVQL